MARGKCSKISNHLSFCSQIKCGLLVLELTKCLSEYITGKTMIKVLLKKQFVLGLCCLSRPFLQAVGARNFRTSSVYNYLYID